MAAFAQAPPCSCPLLSLRNFTPGRGHRLTSPLQSGRRRCLRICMALVSVPSMHCERVRGLVQETVDLTLLCMQEPLVVEKLERTEKAYKALTVGPSLQSTARCWLCLFRDVHVPHDVIGQLLACFVQVQMSDPDVASNATEFQKVARAAAEMEDQVSAYDKYKAAQAALKDAKELLRDSDGEHPLSQSVLWRGFVPWLEGNSMSDMSRAFEQAILCCQPGSNLADVAWLPAIISVQS